ncbi:MAG: PTS glucose transporter subunit IIA [Acholeplasmataceae bacterium]|nr:PTS glucose transporter subunit IIA [Acholeplasmataceae bacterium]
MSFSFLMPVLGEIEDVSKTPDDTFSKGLVGVGFVVYPSDMRFYAPVDGIIEMIYPTKHALSIHSNEGLSILIHVGFSNQLRESVFSYHVVLNQKVKQGDLLFELSSHVLSLDKHDLATTVVFIQKKHMHVVSTHCIEGRNRYILEVKS